MATNPNDPVIERSGAQSTEVSPSLTKLEYLVAKNVAAIIASGDHKSSSDRLIVSNAIDLAYETIIS